MNIRGASYLLSIILILFSCTKQKETIRSEKSQYYTFPDAATGVGVLLCPQPDNILRIYGFTDRLLNGDLEKLYAIDLNDRLKVVGKHNYDFVPFNRLSSATNTGSVLSCSENGELIKINNKGAVDFKTPFTNSDYFISNPIEIQDGSKAGNIMCAVACMSCPNLNYRVAEFDASGGLLQYINFNKTWFGSPVQTLSLIKFEEPSTYYFSGNKYDSSNFSPSDNLHYFVAKITLAGSNASAIQMVNLDTAIGSQLNYIYRYDPISRLSADGGFTFTCSPWDKIKDSHVARIFHFNKNLQLQWERSLDLEGMRDVSVISMEPAYNNTLLLAGEYLPLGSQVWQGFLCKMDLLGNIIWCRYFGGDKLFGTWHAIQTRPNEILATGVTFSFGNGLNLADMYLLKLDGNGMLK